MWLRAQQQSERLQKCPHSAMCAETASDFSSARHSRDVGMEAVRLLHCARTRGGGTSAGTLGLPRRDTVALWRQYPWLRQRYHFSLNYKYHQWGHLDTHTHTEVALIVLTVARAHTHKHAAEWCALLRCHITSTLVLPARSHVCQRAFSLLALCVKCPHKCFFSGWETSHKC